MVIFYNDILEHSPKLRNIFNHAFFIKYIIIIFWLVFFLEVFLVYSIRHRVLHILPLFLRNILNIVKPQIFNFKDINS